jgi:hypothetical protein
MKKLILGLALAVAVIASARGARAEDAQATNWYGWQTLASDGTAIALWATALAANDAVYTASQRSTYQTVANVAALAGFGVYAFGGPIVHARRGHVDKFGSSLLLRLGLPVAGLLGGGALGWAACGKGNQEDIPCPAVTGAIGLAAGGLAAMVIDAAVVAREPVTGAGARFVQPLVLPTAGGAAFALAGRF